MANNNAANVSTGKPKANGAAYVAPAGTAVPTDASTPLAQAFTNTGYVTADGLVNTITTDSEELKAWGGDTVATPQTGRSETFALTLMELNQTSFEQAFGMDNVEVDVEAETIVIKGNALERDPFVWAFEIILTGGRIMRVVVPNGKVTEVGEINFVDADAITFPLTIAALPDATGNTSYRYIAKVV